MQIRSLAANSPNKYQLLDTACEDLERYVWRCKNSYVDSVKGMPYAERMAYLILAYGGAEPLYRLIKRLHKETIEEYEEDNDDFDLVDSDFFLDFHDLYQKYGDYALFIEKDTIMALKYYELAALDWYYFKGEVEWEISDQEKREVINRVKEFDWLVNLRFGPWNKINQWKRQKVWSGEERYKEIFVLYIYNLKKQNSQKICMYANAFYHALDEMITQHCARNEIRWPLFMAYGIRETSLEYMLSVIRDKGKMKELNETTKRNIFRCIRSNQSKKLKPICDYANRVEDSDQAFECCFDMLEVMEHTRRIINCLRMKPLPDAELAYMNDPNEGRTLQKRLFSGDTPFEGDLNHRKEARYPYVFIKCFTPQIDFLPMWEMYGDHAQGCCLVIDWNRCMELGMEVPLYNVCYLSKVGSHYKVEPQNNANLVDCVKLEQELDILSELCRRLWRESKACLEAVHSILDGILYLFKDASYSYEKEVRIYYQYPEVDSAFRHTLGDFGKLYVATDVSIEIKEVILGPKFMNRSDVMPYLQEQVDIMCKECGTRAPKITLSDIEYRQDFG